VAAQESTPGAEATPVGDFQPVGSVNLRLRQLAAADLRPEIDEIVQTEFVPEVQALPGYAGYLLGDVLDDERQNLAIVVMEDADQMGAFNTSVQAFVGGLDPKFAVETVAGSEGDVLIVSAPGSTSATPVVADTADTAGGGYVAARIHTSKPGTDPRDFVPLVIDGFLPILQGLSGFQGYLWFPSEGGFTAVSLFDSEASAEESTVAAADFAAEHLVEYTDGNPVVINATVVFADLPILGGA
jgi:hypothetical protein